MSRTSVRSRRASRLPTSITASRRPVSISAICRAKLAAENAGQTTFADPNDEILRGWIQSPDHRRNLYSPPFNRTGIGFARAADGTWYVTQLYVTVPR